MPVNHNGVSYFAADAHAHIYPGKIAEKATASVGDFYGLHMNYTGLPEILAESGGGVGIDRFLVCSVATKVEQVKSINLFIQRACLEFPQFLGLAAWHQDIEDVEGELEDIRCRGLRGIKLHPDFQRFSIDDPKMLPLYRAAQREGLPILFHMGDDRTDFSAPRRLANVLEQLPDLTCIAAHLGGYTQWKEARDCLRGANVFVDTSSSLMFLSQEEALASIEHFGLNRVMYGTDFPMWDAKEELERFFALGLGEADNRAILYGNFARLFGLDGRRHG